MVMLRFKIWAKGITSCCCLFLPGHTLLLLTFCRLWCLSDNMRSQFSTLEWQKSINTHTIPFTPHRLLFWQQNDYVLGLMQGKGSEIIQEWERMLWNWWLGQAELLSLTVTCGFTLLCESFDLRFGEPGSLCIRKKTILSVVWQML